MKEEEEAWDESLLWLFSEQLFRDQHGLQDKGRGASELLLALRSLGLH